MALARMLWHSYKYLPYELRLARREIETLLGGSIVAEDSEGLVVELSGISEQQLARLTYFRRIELDDGRVLVPAQARLEASAMSSWKSEESSDVVLRHQSTRYSAHGLHEYKGKFNPQIVRAVGNIVGIEANDWVFDPFCGCGTTLLESVHLGWNAIGTDLNPLAVLIANTKIEAIHTDPQILQRLADQVVCRLEERSANLSYEYAWTEKEINELVGSDWKGRLPNFRYLVKWFPQAVLVQFVLILETIAKVIPVEHREIFAVILSDLVRNVSWQEPADLRIRRRKDPRDNYPVIPMFVESIRAKLRPIWAARKVITPRGYQRAFHGDSRQDLGWVATMRGDGSGFDAIISSPPYVTALPYIDTHRLSLCLLGLLKESEVQAAERELVGSREISTAYRRTLEELIQSNTQELPGSVVRLCREMLQVTVESNDGFRRRNMPALVYRYFLDMRRVLIQLRRLLRPGGIAAFVLGMNQSQLNGTRFIIDTPKLLGEIAETLGWKVREITELDTYKRYALHYRNSIREEYLLVMQRPN